MKILITGCAGFIGFHLCEKLSRLKNINTIGIDNLNNYYDQKLKKNRLKILLSKNNFKYFKNDITNKGQTFKALKDLKIDIIVHLAAQAGVRESFLQPQLYKKINIDGFENILELAKIKRIKHLIYASSSSVYGNSTKMPLKESDNTDNQVSYYGATKKINEVMASIFNETIKIPITGLRFFTVYGPYGRPDMAPHLFTNAIIRNKKIQLFNNGLLKRDFTYIDDVIEALIKIIKSKPKNNHEIYNIGKGKTDKLKDFIKIIEKSLSKKAKFNHLGMQKGDVYITHASVKKLINKFNYQPKTNLNKGLAEFVRWYLEYYKVK